MLIRKTKVVTADRFGNAPEGLKHGDIVKTDRGRYQVVDRKLRYLYDDCRFNEETGYYSTFIGLEVVNG